jgi:hypothetical protein
LHWAQTGGSVARMSARTRLDDRALRAESSELVEQASLRLEELEVKEARLRRELATVEEERKALERALRGVVSAIRKTNWIGGTPKQGAAETAGPRRRRPASSPLSPMVERALHSMVDLSARNGGVSARDLARDWGQEDERSTRASAHTYLERLADAGYAVRLPGSPARYEPTPSAKEYPNTD